MRIMNFYLFLVLLSCHNEPDTSHLENDLLNLEAKIPLQGVRGRIDHMGYDPAEHRVFVAALGNNTVEVVDLHARARVHSITGLHEPQGVLFIPSLRRLVVANGGNGECVFYDAAGFTRIGSVALGDDADNVRYDGNRVYVGYGSGGIAMIDPATIQKVGDLLLQAHPESFQLGDSERVFINLPDAGSVVMGDLGKRALTKTWRNEKASANFPMALDGKNGRLFIGYRHAAMVRVLDLKTGAVQASLPCVGDADDLFFDEALGLLFVSGGDGYVEIFRKNMLVNHIATAKGARTSLWLPYERKLIVAVPAMDNGTAALWVYGMK